MDVRAFGLGTPKLDVPAVGMSSPKNSLYLSLYLSLSLKLSHSLSQTLSNSLSLSLKLSLSLSLSNSLSLSLSLYPSLFGLFLFLKTGQLFDLLHLREAWAAKEPNANAHSAVLGSPPNFKLERNADKFGREFWAWIFLVGLKIWKNKAEKSAEKIRHQNLPAILLKFARPE